MTTTTSTTIDPLSVPCCQRFYTTHVAGIPPWIFALVFVILAIAVLVMAVALSRTARSQ